MTYEIGVQIPANSPDPFAPPDILWAEEMVETKREAIKIAREMLSENPDAIDAFINHHRYDSEYALRPTVTTIWEGKR